MPSNAPYQLGGDVLDRHGPGTFIDTSKSDGEAMMEGTHILVTGGAGFVGSSLVERLAPRNEVTIIDDLSSGSLRNLESAKGRIHLVKASVLNRESVLRAGKSCTIAFHLAALTSVPESFDTPERYADTNVMGTANVLAAAHHAGIRRVVFASTCAVYGPSRASRLVERSEPKPASPYAMSKLAAEQLCEAATSQTDLEVVVLRIFNAYGPRQSASSPYASVIARFIRAARNGEAIVIFGSGTQTRDFIYVADVIDAFERAATAKNANRWIFNVGTGTEVSILRLAETLESVVGKKLPIRTEAARPGDVARALADTGRAEKVLGFKAKTPLAEGLRRTLAEAG